jgi:hypothetical protein
MWRTHFPKALRRETTSRRKPSRACLSLEYLEAREQPANFTPGNLVILRVNDGVNTYAKAAPVFLTEYTPSGNLVQQVTVPNTQTPGNNGNQPLTLAYGLFNNGQWGSQMGAGAGQLSRSFDGTTLAFSGIAANVNSGTIATDNRAIAVTSGLDPVDPSFFNTKTYGPFGLLDDAIRAVQAVDATHIYSTGKSGLLYHPGTASGSGISTGTQIDTFPAVTNERGLHVAFNNQVFWTTSALGNGVITQTAGVGGPAVILPTSTATNTKIINNPGGGNLNGLFAADMNGDGVLNDNDRMYLLTAQGGLHVSTLSGGVWSAAVQIDPTPQVGAVTPNAVGLAGKVINSTQVQLYYTVFDGVGNTGVFGYEDGGVGHTTVIAPTPQAVSNGINYTGVAFAPVAATSLTLDVSTNGALPGTNVTMTANISSPNGTPTGLVYFIDNDNTILNPGGTTIVNGVATFNTSSLTTGQHRIHAYYAGGLYNGLSDAIAPANSNTELVSITGAAASAVSVASASSQATLGQTVSFTATVTPTSPAPTGFVEFFDTANGTTVSLGIAPVSGSGPYTAVLPVAGLALGAHSISVSYYGDATYQVSSSTTPFALTINNPATISVSGPGNGRVTPGTSVIYTATVVGNGISAPTGTVEFTDGLGGPVIGTGNLTFVSGNTYTATSPAHIVSAGGHLIYATYNADSGNTSYAAVTTTTPWVQTGAQNFAIGNLVVLERPNQVSSASQIVALKEYTPTGSLVQTIYMPVSDGLTTSAAPISAGTQVVTPASMNGIMERNLIRVGTGPNAETVEVTATTATTFTATFTKSHAAGVTIAGNNIFGLSGRASTQGALALSENQSYLSLFGFDAPIGTPSLTGTDPAIVGRTVARVDVAGIADTSTTVLVSTQDAFGNARGAVSIDGKNYYVVGSSGSGTNTGVQRVTGGQVNNPATPIAPNGTDGFAAQILGGNLYVSTQESNPNATPIRMFRGTPDGSATPHNLPGLTNYGGVNLLNPGGGSSTNGVNDPNPYGFLLFNHTNGTSVNPDTLYVADQTYGLLKFSNTTAINGDPTTGNWTFQSQKFNSNTSIQGLVGYYIPNDPDNGGHYSFQLYATAAISNGNPGNQLLAFKDKNDFDAPATGGTFTVLANAPDSTFTWSGLAFAPLHTSTISIASSSPTSVYGQPLSTTFTATVSNATGADAPTGSVSFYIDGNFVGSGNLSNGPGTTQTATFVYNSSSLPVGAHEVTAKFGGTSTIGSSTSAPAIQSVTYAAGDLVVMQVGTANTSNPLTNATVDPTTFIATFTTQNAHNLKVGEQVVVSDSAIGFNGSYFVLSVPSATTFTVQTSSTNLAGRTSVSSISQSGSTVSVVTTAAHGYASGQQVAVVGLGSYNGTYTITVINPFSFTYMLATPNLPPSSGGTVTVLAANTGSIGGLGSAATEASILNYSSSGALIPGNTVALPTAGAVVDITSISQSGTTVTVTAPAHGFSAGQNVTITGAGIGNYNGTYRITSVTAGKFTYTAANGLNSAAITSASQVGNTITIGTSNALVSASFRPGQTVTIAGVGSGYDGTYTIVSAPTASTFTVVSASTNLPPVSNPPGATATIASATGGTAVIAASGTITQVGSAVAEGFLTRSLDQHTVTFGGYSQTPGYMTSNVTGLAGVLAPNGTVDTSTQISAGDSGNFNIALRAVASADGKGFYIASGNNVRYVSLPNSGSTLPAAYGITSITQDSKNVVTVTTDSPHGYSAGQRVSIQFVQVGGYNGSFTITSVTPTTFTYNLPATTSNLPASSGGAATLVSSTSISDFYSNPNMVGLTSANQLYISGGAGIQPNGVPPIDGPTPIGTGAPVTGGQGGVQLGGLPTSRDSFGAFPSSLQFSFTPDGRTVFVADSRNNSLGGLYEYSDKAIANSWTLIKEYHIDTFTIGAISQTGNLVTATTTFTPNYTVGQQIVVGGVPGASGYNGTFTVAAVTDNSFSYYAPAGLDPSFGGVVSAADSGFTSLSASYSGNNATFYVTTSGVSGNRILKFENLGDDFIDQLPISNNPSVGAFTPYTVIATAPAGTAFRGVSLAPTAPGTTATTTTLAVSGSPATYGSPVTLTATVSNPAATGWVSFRDASGKELGTAKVSLVSGQAQAVLVSLTNISAGAAQSITATYTGDATFAPSTSSAASVTVNKQTPTSAITTSIPATTTPSGTTFNVAPNSIFTLNSTLTVTPTSSLVTPPSVYSTGVLPTGTVTFVDTSNGNQVVGIGGVEQFISTNPNTGVVTIQFIATIQGSLSLANPNSPFEDHVITATYSGDANFNAGTAATFTIRLANPTNVAVTTSNPSPGPNGDAITITARLTSVAGTPEGTVQFYDNLIPIGVPVVASGGIATINLTTSPNQTTSGTYALTPGLHSITAVYTHDGVLSPTLSDGIGVYQQQVSANAFNPNNFLVQRVGDGVNRLLGQLTAPFTSNTSYGSAIFIEEYDNAGNRVQSLALPTSNGPTSQIATATANGTTTVSITTAAPHSFSTGQTVTISGLTRAAANGTFAVTVTGISSFTYTTQVSITSGSIGSPTALAVSTIRAIAANGQQSSVGQLAISPDGQYLFATGYNSNALLNRSTSVQSNTISRGVARINLTGNPGSVSTVAFVNGTGIGSVQTGGNISGVYTPDGDKIYVSGFNGVSYLPSFSASISANLAAGTTIVSSTSPINYTPPGLDFDGTKLIVNGYPYVGSPTVRLAGSLPGLPTTASTVSALPGLPSTNTTQTFGVSTFFTHLEGPGAPAGINTMYLSDNGPSFANGRISKWALVGGVWTLVGDPYVLSGAANGSDALTFYYLSGITDNTVPGQTAVTLYSNYAAGGNGTDGRGVTGPGFVYKLVDTNGYNQTFGTNGVHSNAVTTVAEVGTVLAGTTNQTFRGVETLAAYGTKTILVGTPNPTTGGSLITYTATVSAGAGDPALGTVGTVSFFDNGALIPGGQNVPVVNGVAVFQTSLVTGVGDHPITATYSGSVAGRFAGSTSNTFTQTITAGSAAPQFTGMVVNGGDMYAINAYGIQVAGLAANNSIIEQLYVTFDIGVTLGAGAFTLDAGPVSVNIPGSVNPVPVGTNVVSLIAEADPTTIDVNGGHKGYRLRFSGSATYLNTFDNSPTGNGGSGNIFTTLKDGFYKLNIVGANVHAGASVAGTPMSGNSTQSFWTMYASYSPDDRSISATPGDGSSVISVNSSVIDFANTNGFGYGTSLTGPSGQAYNANFDWNLDGDVGDDLIEFAKRFGAEWTF